MNEYICALTIQGKKIYIGRANNPYRCKDEHLNDLPHSPKSLAIQRVLGDGFAIARSREGLEA